MNLDHEANKVMLIQSRLNVEMLGLLLELVNQMPPKNKEPMIKKIQDIVETNDHLMKAMQYLIEDNNGE